MLVLFTYVALYYRRLHRIWVDISAFTGKLPSDCPWFIGVWDFVYRLLLLMTMAIPFLPSAVVQVSFIYS